MSQITGGLRKLLSYPWVYNAFQSVIGSYKFRKNYSCHYVRPFPKCRILDIGCGTGEMLDFLPASVEYHGYDASSEYIQAATKRYGSRGQWHCVSILDMHVEGYGTFDIVMANGVLHHLEDREASQLFYSASRALKPGGRLCTCDGCFVTKQNSVARFLISRDRGQNIRTPEGYQLLIEPFFQNVELTIRHDMLRVPYTHAIMVATKEDHS